MGNSGSPSDHGNAPVVLGQPLAERERRPPPRLPIQGQVLRIGSEEARWTSVDMSVGGIYVSGAVLYPQNSIHDLELCLPDESEQVDLLCRARVAWTNGPESRRNPGLPEGMGLQFLDLDPETRDRLRIFLQQLASRVTPRRHDVVARYLAEFEAICRADQGAGPTRAETPRPREIAARVPPADPAPGAREDDEEEIIELVDLTCPQRGRSSTAAILESGAVLGSYRVLRLVGSGSMGDVYLARHRRLGRLVALKRLRSDVAGDPDTVRRFFQEAQRISQLNHPNIVEVIDFIEERDEHCYVMEWLPGISLGRWRGQGEAMPIPRAHAVCLQLCDALELLHAQGIVHRDLKPDNVMLLERAEGLDLVKLLDFSVSRFVNPSTGESLLRTQTGMVLGTPGYLAPEQIVGMEIDHRCDLYAMGVLMYQLFTGRKPFVAESWPELLFKHSTQQPQPPSERAPHALPPALDALILQCLEKDPQRRPQSAAEIRARLEAMADQLHEQQEETAPQEAPGAARWPRGVLVGIALMLWVLLLALVLSLS